MSDSTFTLSALDVAIIVCSLLLVVLVGLRAGRGRSESAKGYFLASEHMPWWIIGSAFVSTSVSSEQIVGTVGFAYQHGMAIANWEWFSLPAYTLLLVFFIPLYLKNRITTVPDYLSRRFGPLCGSIYSWVMLPAYVLIFMVTILYSASLALSSLTGWNFYVMLWGVVILVGLYTIKGGLASVMWTDALQCVMLLGGGLVLYFVSLGHIPGGWGAMAAANPERFHLYQPPSDQHAPFLGMIFSAVGVSLFYQSSNQVMMQRVLAARSTWDGLIGIIFAGFINFFRPLVTCFLGFIVYYWIYDMHCGKPLANPDTTFPYALTHFAPSWGLRGVILAGFIAAVMSATSALANSTATIFALEIYKRMFRPNAEEKVVVRTGQFASLLALAIAALVCPAVANLGGIFRYFQTGVTWLATPFISVFLLGILWKRANYPGAIFGLVGGLGIQATVSIGAEMLGLKLHWFYTAAIAEALTMIGVVVVSLATKAPDREGIEPLIWRPALLKVFHAGPGRHWYHQPIFWYGLYAAIWFSIYWKFW